MALPKRLHREIWPQIPKFPPKKPRFWVLLPENDIQRSLKPNFFFYLDNTTSLEVSKKISLHISQNWLRYDHLKWRGKTEKRKKQSFLGIFGKNWVLKWVPTVWICGWRCIMMWETKRKKSHDGGSSLGYPKVPKKGPKSKK